MRLLALLVAVAIPALSQRVEDKQVELLQSQQIVTKSYACEAPADVQALINFARRAGPGESLQQLAAQHPGDFWIQRSYIDSAISVGTVASDELVSEFRQGFDARPDDPETACLYAYGLLGKNTPKAIEILTSLTVKVPSFPLPWLSLSNIHSFPAFRDKAKMQAYGEGFLERCPDSKEALALASRLDRSDALVAFVRGLRQRIAGRADEGSVSLYPALWNLELQVATSAERPQVLQGIEEDLKFLNRQHSGRPVVRSALMEGYKLTFNTKALGRLSAQAAQPPASSTQAHVQADREGPAANAVPPVTRIWEDGVARGADAAIKEQMKELLDKYRAHISQALQSDLYDVPLADQDGRARTFVSLKGKTTLINLWFTSCGPCRAEMPYLQKLYEQVKDRDDMQVVTLNVDKDEELVRPFLDENRYTFPVLFAGSIAHLADGIIAPSTWILDSGGTIRMEDTGFGGDGEQWLKRTLAQMESVRSNGP